MMLTLMDAVGGYQQGVDWKNRNDELKLQQAARQRGLDADAAAAKAYRDAMGGDTAPAPAGPGLASVAPANAAPPMGDPSAPTMPAEAAPGLASTAPAAPAAPAAAKPVPDKAKAILAAYEARGNHFANAGDWHGYMENEAKVAPLRAQIRVRAMQQYGVDKDPVALAKAVYPTIFDGKEITAAEIVPGGDQNAPKGAPSGAPKMRVTLNDGTTSLVDPNEFVAKVSQSLVDPVAFAQKQAEAQLWQAKNDYETKNKLKVEEVKGKNAMGLADVNHGYKKEEIGIQQAGAEKVANIHAGATMGAAGILADSREKVATTKNTGPGGGPKVQKVITDSDGFATAIFKDGTSKRMQIDGKPIKANDYSKRVDSLVNQMRKSSSGFGKSEAELRAAAEQSLSGGGSQATPQPAAGGKDFSNLWN
jgi:hypothetical protein